MIEVVQLGAARASRRRQSIRWRERDLVEAVGCGRCGCRRPRSLIREIQRYVEEASQVHAHGAAWIDDAECPEIDRRGIGLRQAGLHPADVRDRMVGRESAELAVLGDELELLGT